MPGPAKISPTKRALITAQLGVAIRVSREQAGWTQEKLAEFSALSKNYIGSVERGEYAVTLPVLEQIAKALRCKASDLLRAAGH